MLLQTATEPVVARPAVPAHKRSRSLPPVSIERLGPNASDEVVAMLVEASFDQAVREKNYLPACMDTVQARQYCATSDAVVLLLGDRPVGVVAVLHEPSPGEGVEIPPGCVEFEMWILAPFRGQGMRWFPLVSKWLARRFDYLLGVTWETNQTAIALLRWSGWKQIGRSFWRGEGPYAHVQGYCEVFLYDLRPHREP